MVCRRSVALVSQNFRLGDLFELVVQGAAYDVFQSRRDTDHIIAIASLSNKPTAYDEVDLPR